MKVAAFTALLAITAAGTQTNTPQPFAQAMRRKRSRRAKIARTAGARAD